MSLEIRKTDISSGKMRKWKFLLGMILLFFGVILNYLALWYRDVYTDVGFDAILGTLLANLRGTDQELFRSCLEYVLRYILLWGLFALVLWYRGKRRLLWRMGADKTVQLYPVADSLALLISIAAALVLTVNAAIKVGVPSYVSGILNPTTLFEEEYWHPEDAKVTFPEEKRNLIYILLNRWSQPSSQRKRVVPWRKI